MVKHTDASIECLNSKVEVLDFFIIVVHTPGGWWLSETVAARENVSLLHTYNWLSMANPVWITVSFLEFFIFPDFSHFFPSPPFFSPTLHSAMKKKKSFLELNGKKFHYEIKCYWAIQYSVYC